MGRQCWLGFSLAVVRGACSLVAEHRLLTAVGCLFAARGPSACALQQVWHVGAGSQTQ